MTPKAHVTAVDALEAFRADLVLYISKARPTLEEVSGDVLRARLWLENEQRTYWDNQLRRRTRELEEAQQALFSARISNLREETSAEVNAFHRAKRARDHAEGKLRTLKKWNRDFENRVQPLVKQTEKLHTILANDLVQAMAYLAQALSTLDAYAGTPPPSAAPAPGPAPAGAGKYEL
jgi:chromosome segregation ATPase